MDVVVLMDSDGNGKGEMWIGVFGWVLVNVNEVKVCDYGLMDFVELICVEESVKIVCVKDFIVKGEGYVFYCYKLYVIWYMFDVKMLIELIYDLVKYIMV